MIKTHEEETNAKSSFWSTCFLVYSAAQLALAAAGYTHPHLAPTLYDIQTYALPLDAIFAGGLFYSEAKMFHIVPEKNKEIKRALKLATLSIALLFAYRWMKSYSDATSLLKGALPEKALKEIKITHTPPLITYDDGIPLWRTFPYSPCPGEFFDKQKNSRYGRTYQWTNCSQNDAHHLDPF